MRSETRSSYVVRLASNASFGAIESALGRLRARRVALLFPLGAPVALTNANAWDALHRHCDALDISLALVGGDEALRAAAVAADFVVATSLDLLDLRAERSAPVPAADGARLTLVTPGADAPADDDDDSLPHYVRALLEQDGAYSGPRDHDSALERRLARITRPLADEEIDDLQRRHESFEDGMTLKIRDTSGWDTFHEWLGSARSGLHAIDAPNSNALS